MEAPLVPSTPAELRAMLATAPIFHELPADELSALAERASEHFFAEGQMIIEEGEPSDTLFVLFSGRVRVLESTHDPLDTTLVLGELGPGEVVGEVGILTDKPRSATVVAVEPTHCTGIPESEFSLLLDRAPQLALGLSRVLAERIYETDRRLARYAPDPLTSLPSRLAFHDHYARAAAQARRRETGVILAVLDILNLKAINDQFGYAVGDEVIRTVAKALMESARKSDLVARYGGDEFAVLLVDADASAVDRIANRVRRKLADLTPRAGLPITVECAIGAASSRFPPETAYELFRQADQDMQARKEAAKSPPPPPTRRRSRARPEA
jgi:diguanylate cyclase (GGDEF)-like protein